MTYEKIKWKTLGLYKADPVKVYEELQTIDERTPDAIVELARDTSSALHDLFDWNDKTAADKWRKQQARIIACNLVVETVDVDREPIELRLYHMPEDNHGYEEISFFLTHEDEYKKLLNQAKRDLDSFKAKYHTLKELKPIFKAINDL